MRRRLFPLVTPIVALFVVTMSATPASAAEPEKGEYVFADSHPFFAGQVCDFNYFQEFLFRVSTLTFFDGDGDVVRYREHVSATVIHVNVDTGYTLTESDVVNSTTYEARGTAKRVGLQWHLREPGGKPVLTVAGLITYQLEPFAILHITPRVERFLDFPRFPRVICGLLGGAAA